MGKLMRIRRHGDSPVQLRRKSAEIRRSHHDAKQRHHRKRSGTWTQPKKVAIFGVISGGNSLAACLHPSSRMIHGGGLASSSIPLGKDAG
jgi:hypothetical protein